MTVVWALLAALPVSAVGGLIVGRFIRVGRGRDDAEADAYTARWGKRHQP